MKKVIAATPSSRESFEQHLLGYSSLSRAALATGATVIGATATASAQTLITIAGSSSVASLGNTPGYVRNSSAPVFHLGLPGSPGVSAIVTQSNRETGAAGIAQLFAKQGAHSVNIIATSDFGAAINFARNQRIAGLAGLSGYLFKTIADGLTGGGKLQLGVKAGGNFNLNQTGYIGFKFNNGIHTYYGWLRVNVTGDTNGRPTSLTLVSEGGDVGAYALADSFGGQNIEAGQVSAIPEPSSVASGLALLALGAAGVHEMRRRRKVAA